MPNKLQFSTNFVFAIISILLHFACETEGKEKSIDKMIEDSKNKQVARLTCHVCHSETDKSCKDFTESGEDFFGFPQNCSADENMCVVKKFALTLTDRNGTTTNMSTFSVKRNCSRKCDAGCVVMGERTRLYVCSSCCSTPLCNVGSSAGRVQDPIQSISSYLLKSIAGLPFHLNPVLRCLS